MTRMERSRLEDLLKDDDALHYYLEMTAIEVNLPFELAPPSESTPSSATYNIKQLWTRPLPMVAAIAISFAAGIFSNQWVNPSASTPQLAQTPGHSQPATTQNAATITSLIGVNWDGPAPDSLVLKSKDRAIRMSSGLMELTFASGVRTLIEGPADIQVTGINQAQLSMGRLVADVPKGAEGFTVNYAGGKVIDLGTEFAMFVPGNREAVEVGVFRGEVEVYDDGESTPKTLTDDHAVLHGIHSDTPFQSIPFQRKNYVRFLPSREFTWELPATASTAPAVMEFDVSHLVWKSGDYRAIIKWMKGHDALIIRRAELLRDGQVIATDAHQAKTGMYYSPDDNTYSFSIPEDAYRKGLWKLRITGHANDRAKNRKLGSFTADSSGLLLFEDQYAGNITDKSFIGTWRYSHDGDIYERTFTADHRVQFSINGKPNASLDGATWEVKHGILTLTVRTSGYTLKELHMLRNDHELIFMNQRYRNAKKVSMPATPPP